MNTTMPIRALILAVAVLLSTVVDAGSQGPIRPGDYITDDGWGHLSIKRNQKGALIFSIQTVGANAHSCNLAGTIRGGTATLRGLDKKPSCIVTFTPNDEGIDVASDTHDQCRSYCGARAGFDGLFLTPPPGCAPSAVSKTRAAFKALYDKQSYAEARATLEPALERCAGTLDRWKMGTMRNDLAITLYHLGDLAACRKVLAPYAAAADSSDEKAVGDLPPADAETYLGIIKAVRTNLQLCRAKEQ